MMRTPSCWSDDTIVPSRCLVVKRLYRKPTESHRAFIKRATSEYCITCVLNHINVVGASNLIMENYHFCIVLNLDGMGDSLSTMMKYNPIDPTTVFSQLVHGVKYLHQLGIAHRNIQPDTILVFPDGVLKLSGFSDAHVFRPPLHTQPIPCQGKVGQLPYQPPEVLGWWDSNKGKKEPYNAPMVDIWSMGMVLVYLLKKGQLPCPYTQCLDDLPWLLHRMLDPDPCTRIDIQHISNSHL
ncbi:kinase-like domain-containing protein [Chlamydoabsidia padenii]|nr:kinase-like domain-containing protein [Chlamydoabsidia padenii]